MCDKSIVLARASAYPLSTDECFTTLPTLVLFLVSHRGFMNPEVATSQRKLRVENVGLSTNQAVSGAITPEGIWVNVSTRKCMAFRSLPEGS